MLDASAVVPEEWPGASRVPGSLAPGYSICWMMSGTRDPIQTYKAQTS